MSRGKNLQEMENAVTKGAKPAEPMQTMAGVSYEDLGGQLQKIIHQQMILIN